MKTYSDRELEVLRSETYEEEALDVVSRKIVDGGPFHDVDVVRLAEHYLETSTATVSDDA